MCLKQSEINKEFSKDYELYFGNGGIIALISPFWFSLSQVNSLQKSCLVDYIYPILPTIKNK